MTMISLFMCVNSPVNPGMVGPNDFGPTYSISGLFGRLGVERRSGPFRLVTNQGQMPRPRVDAIYIYHTVAQLFRMPRGYLVDPFPSTKPSLAIRRRPPGEAFQAAATSERQRHHETMFAVGVFSYFPSSW